MRSSARTPMATVTSTVISPSVSNPRKSTRITLTTLDPCASRGAASMKYADSLDVVPDAPMDRTSAVTTAPAAIATIPSRIFTAPEERSPKPRNRENTSTKMTTVSVSTANCVIARSGAPRRAYITATLYPTTPSDRTAVIVDRANAADNAPEKMSAARTASWNSTGVERRGVGSVRFVATAVATSVTAVRVTVSTYERSDAACNAGTMRRLTRSSRLTLPQ